MRQLFMIAALFLSVTSSSAQFNDSLHHVIGFNATGNVNRTNDGTNYLFNNSLKYSLRKNDIALNSNSGWIYGESRERKINNDFISTLDFNLYKTFRHFFYWGLANYTKSYSLAINDQEQGGFGIAYNIFDKENFRLNLSDGIIYEHSNIFVNDSLQEEYETFRNSLRLHLRWKYKNRMTVNAMGFFQPSLNYGNDYIVKNSLTFSLKLLKYISFSTDFSYNLVSRTDRESLLLTYGLSVERYF